MGDESLVVRAMSAGKRLLLGLLWLPFLAFFVYGVFRVQHVGQSAFFAALAVGLLVAYALIMRMASATVTFRRAEVEWVWPTGRSRVLRYDDILSVDVTSWTHAVHLRTTGRSRVVRLPPDTSHRDLVRRIEAGRSTLRQAPRAIVQDMRPYRKAAWISTICALGVLGASLTGLPVPWPLVAVFVAFAGGWWLASRAPLGWGLAHDALIVKGFFGSVSLPYRDIERFVVKASGDWPVELKVKAGLTRRTLPVIHLWPADVEAFAHELTSRLPEAAL